MYPAPAPISETAISYCVGSTAICTDATPGGTWSSDAYYTTISSTGVATGLMSGTSYIYYTISGGCSAHIANTVSATYTGRLSAPRYVCVGSTVTVTDSSLTGGTWSSATPSIATIDASGMVTGLSVGTDTINYTVTGICGSSTAFIAITVSNTTEAGTIIGSSSVAAGSTIILYDYSATFGYITSGTWSSSDPSIASIDPSTGIVTGITNYRHSNDH